MLALGIQGIGSVKFEIGSAGRRFSIQNAFVGRTFQKLRLFRFLTPKAVTIETAKVLFHEM